MLVVHKSHITIAALALLLIAGCAVGPNFKKPPAPQVGSYTPAPITTTTSTPNVGGGEAQHIVEGQDIPGEWWALFRSKALDDLIERSLKANPDLKSAQAALLVAQENVRAQRGFYYPSAGGKLYRGQIQNFKPTFACAQRPHFYL